MADLDSASEITVSRSKVGSSLAAALAHFLVASAMRREGQNMPFVSIMGPSVDDVETVLAAARERLRLSRIPCETCDGSGKTRRKAGEWPYSGIHVYQESPCPSCGGSGEVWPDELVGFLADRLNARESAVRRFLDALDLYAKEATK